MRVWNCTCVWITDADTDTCLPAEEEANWWNYNVWALRNIQWWYLEDVWIALPSSQSKIFYICELCVLQTGLRSWMDTCPLENLNTTYTFLCGAGCEAVPCLQLVLCPPLHMFSLHKHRIQMIYRRSGQPMNALTWSHSPKVLFFH